MKIRMICTSYKDYKMNEYINTLHKEGFKVDDILETKSGKFSKIEILTAEDLIKIKDALKQDLIITNDIFDDSESVLEIYDDWRE